MAHRRLVGADAQVHRGEGARGRGVVALLAEEGNLEITLPTTYLPTRNISHTVTGDSTKRLTMAELLVRSRLLTAVTTTVLMAPGSADEGTTKSTMTTADSLAERLRLDGLTEVA